MAAPSKGAVAQRPWTPSAAAALSSAQRSLDPDVAVPVGVVGTKVSDRVAAEIAANIGFFEATVVAIQVGDDPALRVLARLAHIDIAGAAIERLGLLPRRKLL